MAAAAVPVLEFLGQRLLLALGIGALGVEGKEAVDTVRKRQEEAERAKTAPIAKTTATTQTKKCDQCPPDKGAPFVRSTKGWSAVSISYQMRICGLPAGPDFITEWAFNGVTFDGFDSKQCLLKEAKAKYDQFFDDFGVVEEWWKKGEDNLLNEAIRQADAAMPRPPITLRWHFMQPISYRYFSKVIRAMHPDIEVVYQP